MTYRKNIWPDGIELSLPEESGVEVAGVIVPLDPLHLAHEQRQGFRLRDRRNVLVCFLQWNDWYKPYKNMMKYHLDKLVHVLYLLLVGVLIHCVFGLECELQTHAY